MSLLGGARQHDRTSMMGLVAAFITAVLCILGFYFIFLGRTQLPELIIRKPGCHDTPIRYKLVCQFLPPLTGLKLRLTSYLFTSRLGSWFLVPLSLKRGNFQLIDRLVLEEHPTFQPLVHFDGPVSDGSPVEVEHLIAKEQTDGKDGFRFVSISDYYHKYRAGDCIPSDVAENIIRAIHDSEEQDPQLRALVQWDEDEIRKMAAESTERFKLGQPLSVMDGVPVCVKEAFNCIPYILRAGTTFRSQECSVDATLVARLRSAGAMIIGMANMQELGTGGTGINISRYHRTARNPYNVQHYPGGSSSGSAVAVAAGLCPVGIGTDGGGSIRIPATFCGVVGLKGTYGRFSAAGCPASTVTVLHAGPVCSTVRDATIMYGMLAGPDPRDCNTISQPPITLDGFENTDLKGIKIGIYKPYFQDASQEIVETCEKAVTFLQKQGAEVENIEITELEEMRGAHGMVFLSEFRAGMKEDFTNHLRELSSEVSLLLASGSHLAASSYITANKQRTRSINFLKSHIFNKVDVIITPATGVTAPRIDPSELTCGFSNISLSIDISRYTPMGNLLGIPCLSVPVGYDQQGLPIGLQIMGRWWEDHVILRIGNVLQSYMENKLRRPQVYYEILNNNKKQ